MMTNPSLSRRTLLQLGCLGAASATLSACQTTARQPAPAPAPTPQPTSPDGAINYARAYGPLSDGGFPIPAVPFTQIDRRFLRQEVANNTGEPAGKIIVDTADHFLYFTMAGGRAMRYGVGLGRAGFEWSGRGFIKRKAEWPKWHPPAEMIDREPELEKYRTTFNAATGVWEGGMEPGLTNPLGARALYIFQGDTDTLYRLHGSPEWWSIGKSVSSGCVRLINQDIIDLHARVPDGTDILVR